MNKEKIANMAKENPVVADAIRALYLARCERQSAERSNHPDSVCREFERAKYCGKAVEYFSKAINRFESAGLEEEVREIWAEVAEVHLSQDYAVRAADCFRKAGLEDRAKKVLIEKADRLMAQEDYFRASKLYYGAGLQDKVDKAWEKIKDAYLKQHKQIYGYENAAPI